MASKRKHISPSQILTYLRCGEQWRRRYVGKEIIPPGIALVRGSAVHRGAEENFRQKIASRKDLPKNQIIEVAVSTVQEKIEHEGLLMSEEEQKIGKKKIVNSCEQSVKTLTTLYADDVAPKYQPTLVEEERRIPIPNSDTDLTGRLDMLDEKNIIFDMKTSTKKSNPDEYEKSLQMTTYALIHHAVTKSPAADIHINVLVDGKEPATQLITTKRTKDDYVSLMNIVESVTNAIDKEVFTPAYGQTGAWWCSAQWCGYHASCPFVPAHKRGKE